MTTSKKYHIEKNATTQEEIIREYTAEEYAQAALDAEADKAREAAVEAYAALKASAKAKLIAGEPLTAEEADTLVI